MRFMRSRGAVTAWYGLHDLVASAFRYKVLGPEWLRPLPQQ